MLAGVLGRLKNLGLLAAALLAWWYVSVHVLDKTTRTLLPPPTQVLAAAWELIQSGDLWRHVRDSVKRELVAFLWATSSIPLGIAMGWWKAVEAQFDPLVEVLRPVPPLGKTSHQALHETLAALQELFESHGLGDRAVIKEEGNLPA